MWATTKNFLRTEKADNIAGGERINRRVPEVWSISVIFFRICILTSQKIDYLFRNRM